MTARCLRLLTLGVLCVATLASPVAAKTAVVYRTDREQPMRGEWVSEDADQIVIRIANINTPIPRRLIRKIEFELSIPERYQQKTAELADDDNEGRYEAIKWLYSLNALQADRLAEQELNKLLEPKPDHQQAKLLRELVRQRIAARQAEADKNRPDPRPDQPEGDDAAADDGDGPVMLKPEQRNLMKVIEVVLKEKPRVAISNADKLEFYEAHRDKPAMSDYVGERGKGRFVRLDGHEILDMIFTVGDRRYYQKVTMLDEPKPLQTFRQSYAAGLVARHCGSCHGGGEAPGLYLFTDRASGEETAYTNLLILQRTRVGNRHMIDREVPAESLLLQYALPRDEARFAHPDVPRFKQYFSGVNDKRFQKAVQWVGSLYRKANYPVDYQVPQAKAKAEEEPAEQD